MALGTKILAGLIAIPVERFITKQLHSSWRSATGLEPPTSAAAKQERKDAKKASKEGLPAPASTEPRWLDGLMWAALSAMAVIAVRVISERSADEIYRWFVGKNPQTVQTHRALAASGEAGQKQGEKALKQL